MGFQNLGHKIVRGVLLRPGLKKTVLHGHLAAVGDPRRPKMEDNGRFHSPHNFSKDRRTAW